MNSLIFDIRRYTIHDGPGIRTTVFFKGCPLRCSWCHNPESQETGVEQITVQRVLDGKSYESKLAVGSWQSSDVVMKEIEKDEVFYRESGGGVTFSGGEPLLQAEALAELLKACKEKGYHTAIDTSGHAEPAAVRKVMDLADLWLFDLKIIDDSRHVEHTGVSNELVIRNLESLARAGKELIIRFPLVPGITNYQENYDQIADKMIDLGLERIDILPFHQIAGEKYRRFGKANLMAGVKEPGIEEIDDVILYFREKGIVVNNE